MSNFTVSAQLKQLKRNRALLTMVVLLFVCVIFWTMLALITSQTETKISPKLQRYAQPLAPSFDTEILDELEQKKFYSQQDLADFVIYRTLTDPESGQSRIVPLTVSSSDLEAQEAREEQEQEASESAQQASASATSTPSAPAPTFAPPPEPISETQPQSPAASTPSSPDTQ